MGYESTVFIVERSVFPGRGNVPASVSGLVIAEYDLSKVGYVNDEFFGAFKREIDYKLYLPSCDEEGREVMEFLDEDCYGEHMKAASIPDLISALRICEQRDHYRRIPPLIALLESFDKNADEWNNGCSTLEAVHYGY